MAGRVYSAQFNGVAATAQQDLFELNVASTKVVELLSFTITNLTEVGDAQEENLLLLLKTGATVSGSGGSTPTAAPRSTADAAYAGTVEVNNTTKANTGTIITHYAANWNVRVPFEKIFTPDETIWLPPSGRLTLELGTTPTDSITLAGTMVFREYP